MDSMNDTLENTLPERRIDQLLAHYGESHQHPVNERIHFIAIPLIMLSLIGLIFCLHGVLRPFVGRVSDGDGRLVGAFAGLGSCHGRCAPAAVRGHLCWRLGIAVHRP